MRSIRISPVRYTPPSGKASSYAAIAAAVIAEMKAQAELARSASA